MYQALAVIIGFVSGIVWEIVGTTPYKNIPTITPSLLVPISGKILHVHHWLLYLVALIVTALIAWRTHRILHPSTLMIAAFLIGAMAYNFTKFPDWYIFLK